MHQGDIHGVALSILDILSFVAEWKHSNVHT